MTWDRSTVFYTYCAGALFKFIVVRVRFVYDCCGAGAGAGAAFLDCCGAGASAGAVFCNLFSWIRGAGAAFFKIFERTRTRTSESVYSRDFSKIPSFLQRFMKNKYFSF